MSTPCATMMTSRVKARHPAEAWDGAGIFSVRVRVDDGVDDASVTRTKRVTTAREIWFT